MSAKEGTQTFCPLCGVRVAIYEGIPVAANRRRPILCRRRNSRTLALSLLFMGSPVFTVLGVIGVIIIPENVVFAVIARNQHNEYDRKENGQKDISPHFSSPEMPQDRFSKGGVLPPCPMSVLSAAATG